MGGTSRAGEPSWFYRRGLVYVVVAVCFAIIWRLIDAIDNELNRLIAEGCFWTIVALVLTYTGAATVQDIVAIWTMRTARPYADVPLDPTPAAPQPPADQTVVVQPVVMQSQEKTNG